MKKLLTALLGILMALAVNTAVGAGFATVMGVAPLYGILAANGVAAISGLAGGLTPQGVALAGVYTEVWTGFMSKAFRTDPESLGWYTKIRSFDQYANNDVIHFVNIGGDPTVLVNNRTYPLQIENLEDADKAISLDKYSTNPTRITDDELYAISYDKMGSVIERHREALNEKKYSRAIHAIAPNGNDALTPVITTSGADTGDGRKALTRTDVIRLKKLFDKNKVPKSGRILVLCADHIADLLENDQKFNSQYYDYSTGKVSKLYGFEIYEYDECPYYTEALAKLAYGAVPGENDRQASVAFHPVRMMRCTGSVTSYLSKAESDPVNQQNLASFRAYSICLPLKNEAMGAIVSASA